MAQMTHSSDCSLCSPTCFCFTALKSAVVSCPLSAPVVTATRWSAIWSVWILQQIKMLHIRVVPLCSKRYRCVVDFYGRLCGFHSVPSTSGPDVFSSVWQTLESVTCRKSSPGRTLHMLEQNTEVGSMKKTSFYPCLLLAGPRNLFFQSQASQEWLIQKEKISMRNDMCKQAGEITEKYFGILIFTAILCWRIQSFLISV